MRQEIRKQNINLPGNGIDFVSRICFYPPGRYGERQSAFDDIVAKRKHILYGGCITAENIALFKEIVEKSGKIKTVLLSKKVPIDEIVDLLEQVLFDYVQLHRTCDAVDIIELKSQALEKTGRKIGVIAVFEAKDCNFKKFLKLANMPTLYCLIQLIKGGLV